MRVIAHLLFWSYRHPMCIMVKRGGNISPVTPVISHPGGGIVDAGSPISPSSPGDPGGGGFPGGPVGIPSF